MANKVSLGSSAKHAILWGGGFTIFRDFLQFFVMLVLVRVLSPEDYGVATLTQTIVGLIATVSFGTFIQHALQIRDPEKIDWNSHFTFAFVVNIFLFVVTLFIAWRLSFSEKYYELSLPIIVNATVLLLEIPGSLRHRMLESNHDWKRFRILLILGTSLSLTSGLVVGILGGGVWALVIQSPLFTLPAIIDLFFFERWRPNWSWKFDTYKETLSFGLNRASSLFLQKCRQTIEQTLLSGVYSLNVLGFFARAGGLSTLLAGRIGVVTTTTLYPLITRAEQGSERFQKIAGLILQGVCWTTIPISVFIFTHVNELVLVIYGPKWQEVGPIMIYAILGVALNGISSATSNLLLANNQAKSCLIIDIISVSLAIGLALLFIPIGIKSYLIASAFNGLFILILTLVNLVMTNGLSKIALINGFIPVCISSIISIVMVRCFHLIFDIEKYQIFSLIVDIIMFITTTIFILRILYKKILYEFLRELPGGTRISSIINLE